MQVLINGALLMQDGALLMVTACLRVAAHRELAECAAASNAELDQRLGLPSGMLQSHENACRIPQALKCSELWAGTVETVVDKLQRVVPAQSAVAVSPEPVLRLFLQYLSGMRPDTLA